MILSQGMDLYHMQRQNFIHVIFTVGMLLGISGCDNSSWNNPYPQESPTANTLYTAFAERPKHLDPARSYSSGEWTFISQIYEPILQYHYLKRPYVLEPLIATHMPKVTYLDIEGNALADDAPIDQIAHTEYLIEIQPNVQFQPHPAFAKEKGQYLYHHLSEEEALDYKTINDFPVHHTRILTAEDYVYQIKRLADPKLNSPIYGLMSLHIEALSELRDAISKVYQSTQQRLPLDLRPFEFAGAKSIDNTHYRILIKGKYPQFLYWLSMPFFAPIPWEASLFYGQPGLDEHNISLDWYPIGTGPYLLNENNPERRMRMLRNPNFHGERYPTEGMAEDIAAGLLVDANQPLPFIDQIYFSLEKESIPYWNKFLQGYYDNSGISSDNFNTAVDPSPSGGLDVSEALREKGIRLQTSVSPTTMYWAFNMLDDTIGGYSESQRKLRQAISIAFNVEEFIAIFQNGRGVAAQSPLPPEIFGHGQSLNPYVYQTDSENTASAPKRRSLEDAQNLLASAGYPEGRHAKTGEPLVLYFEAISSGDPDEKSVLAWTAKQFEKLGIQLVIRATDYNRFREKMQAGTGQIFFWGWNADYPDPENFLFMFYGPNGKAKFSGENASNYSNQRYDVLFEEIKSIGNSEIRKDKIKQMLEILREDAPWIWGYHPQSFSLSHTWNRITKPNAMARNTLKYAKIDVEQRAQLRTQWNQPLLWPLGCVLALSIFICIPAWIGFRHKEKQKGRRF